MFFYSLIIFFRTFVPFNREVSTCDNYIDLFLHTLFDARNITPHTSKIKLYGAGYLLTYPLDISQKFLGDLINIDLTNCIRNRIYSINNRPNPTNYNKKTNNNWAKGKYKFYLKKKGIPPISIVRFGAKGDGITDNRLAIQRALTSGAPAILIPKGVFIVSLDPSLTTPEGGTGVAINVPSNKTIYIQGKILLKSGTIGNSSVIIGNTSSVKNVHIIGQQGSVDGNRSKVKGKTINVCLWNAIDCSYENLSTENGSFFGLSFRGTVPGYGHNRMTGCRVNNMDDIGIQIAKPSLGFIADHCQVSNCKDNGIDIEGNNPAGDPGFGKDVMLKYCIIKNVANGVFLESVGGVTLINSTIDHANSNAVYINRINSGSFGNKILNNRFLNTPEGTGVNFNSYVGDTEVSNNYFENFKQSISFNGGATNISVGVNTHKKISRYLVNINRLNNSAVKCVVAQQLLNDAPKNGFPETTTPLSNTENFANRIYLTSIKPAYSLKTGKKLPGTFIRRQTTTAKNSEWNAYAVYYKQQTIQYLPDNSPNVGEYVKINGTIFYVFANLIPGEYILQRPKGKDGNFTSITNGIYPVTIYLSEWMEQ
ncbi:hypothetical protein GCM10028808_12140 [Spirosoma migulaei]